MNKDSDQLGTDQVVGQWARELLNDETFERQVEDLVSMMSNENSHE